MTSEKDVAFGEVRTDALRLCSVTHDILGDPFWAVYRRGLADAAVAQRVVVRHRAPEHFSPGEMAVLLEDALADRPDGLLTTVPDAGAVEGPLREVISRGIPVIAVNARDPRPVSQRIPYLRYIGAEDVEGGHAAADALLARGDRRAALWIDHYLVDNACHVARGAGFAQRMTEHGARVALLRVPGDDPAACVEAITSELRADTEIDAVCTLGPPGCAAAIAALEDTGRLGQTGHASFDLAPAQLAAVRDGRLTCTIDSQQYLQGYLGVTLLALHARHGFLPAGDVHTGPFVVDEDTVDAALASVEAGVR